LNIAEVTEH